MPKPATSDPTKAIGYARASTSRQDLSPGAQRAAVEAWAAARGVTVVAWFEDLGISGGAELDKRPGLLAAIDALRTHGAGALVVARRDRLARDGGPCQDLIELGRRSYVGHAVESPLPSAAYPPRRRGRPGLRSVCGWIRRRTVP